MISYIIIALLFYAFPSYSSDEIMTILPTQSNIDNSNTGTNVHRNGDIYHITGGSISQNGTNLFHSFEQFNINLGGTALFSNDISGDNSVTTIISRVTGESRSEIFGTIKTSGFSNANLFFMNPSGILFGPGANLDIGGSFYATTASVIEFIENDIRFSSDPGKSFTLTSSPISSFGFIETPKDITIQGISNQNISLSVKPGHELSFLGGGIKINNANLSAPDGRISIMSLSGNNSDLSINRDISKHTGADRPYNLGLTALDSSSISIAPPIDDAIDIFNSKNNQLSEINIISGSLMLTNNSQINASAMRNTVGNIYLEADTLILDNSHVLTSTSFENPGGSIVLNALEHLEMTGSAKIESFTTGIENAGLITISSPKINLDGNPTQSSNVMINARSVSQGMSGNINIFTDELHTNNATIANESGGSGAGGNIMIRGYDRSNPANSIIMNGESINSNTLSSTAGSITINADFMQLTNSEVTSQAAFGVSTFGNIQHGKPGNITISITDSLTLNQDGKINVTTLGTNAGNIDITTGNLIQLNNESAITSSALGTGEGKGGDITMASKFVILDNQSEITSQATNGPGGKININADFLFNSPDSLISAQSSGNIDGIVAVTAPDENIISSTLTLSDTYLNMPNLSANPCASRTDSNSNSLIIRDSSGIAAEPDSMLSASSPNLNQSIAPVSLQTIGETIVLSELECSAPVQP